MKALKVDLPEIDAIDRRIIIELQADGRMTNVELARRAGISAPPCLRRVRRLEETGIIRGYHAETDPQKLGFAITFFVIIGLDTQKDAALAAFERLVATWPEVRECHMIRGGGDFLIRLVARDTAQENELTRKLTEAPGVATVRSLQTIRHEPDGRGRAALTGFGKWEGQGIAPAFRPSFGFYQLLTRFAAFSVPMPVAKSHPVPVP